MKTHYSLLGVENFASETEVRAAFRRLVRKHHPDIDPHGGVRLQELNAAYSVLSDPKRRADYDRWLQAQHHPNAPDFLYTAQQRGEIKMSELIRSKERPRTAEVGIVVAPPTFHQLGVMVLDGSGSMEETTVGNVKKSEAVNVAVREMLTRFKVSSYVDYFSFAVVTFDQTAKTHTSATPARDIDDNADYDPLVGHGGGTDIGAGLAEARRVADQFLREAGNEVPASVVIVLMSDGRDGEGGVADPAATRRIAEEVKGMRDVTLCTTYFAHVGSNDKEAQEHLRGLASNPVKGYKTVYDAKTLREFFIASLAADPNVRVV